MVWLVWLLSFFFIEPARSQELLLHGKLHGHYDADLRGDGSYGRRQAGVGAFNNLSLLFSGTDVDEAYVWLVNRAGGGNILILRVCVNSAQTTNAESTCQ